MPLGLGGLTGLQTLSRVIIGGPGECKISDLKDMLHLRGRLSIEGLHQVKDVRAKEVNLHKKKGIYDLQMKWSDVFDNSRDGKTEYEVLEGLRPSKKLTNLKIVNYMGTKFPSWVGDSSFVFLTQLTLRGCRSCTCLPTLGHLPSLQELIVECMEGLKSLGSQLLGPSNSWHGVPFPSLEVLEFKDMMCWEEWSTLGGDTAGAFPCLHQLSILNCPKLDVVAMELIPSLQVLHVAECSIAVLKSMVGVSSSIATLTMDNIKGLTQLHGEVLEHLKAVEDLSIWHCDEIIYLWESEAAACEILVNLQSLKLGRCASLVSLGEKEEHFKIGMKSVKEVSIMYCPRLERYTCPNSLEKLEVRECASLVSLGEKEEHLKMGMESVTQFTISDCPRLRIYNCPSSIEKLKIYRCPSLNESLTFPTKGDLPSTLKELEISSCGNVSWLLCNFFSSLEYLNIYRMSNLRLFPERCLVHLTRLTINGCDTIESIPYNGYGFLPFLCLRYLGIWYCKKLKSFPHEQLQNLTSLEEMEIGYCPSLDFPLPCGLWPPKLCSLKIGGLKKAFLEWGRQNFPTSLVTLYLFGDENSDGVVSFGAKAEEEDVSSFILPSSLTQLHIRYFNELESLSEGLQHLTCLQHLDITRCPKLRDLPETLLPSLLSLQVSGESSLELRKKCRRSRKGKYWPIISQIPHLDLELDVIRSLADIQKRA